MTTNQKQNLANVRLEIAGQIKLAEVALRKQAEIYAEDGDSLMASTLSCRADELDQQRRMIP